MYIIILCLCSNYSTKSTIFTSLLFIFFMCDLNNFTNMHLRACYKVDSVIVSCSLYIIYKVYNVYS